ncbi:hypothetical protein LRR81_12080 [Metabacillus sp. GX 13764]|uniref:UPF0738 family protein n=1 Tax=Metabacillus kandeliae TaxID=2900151 RepID=UPI001E583767|nr:hypothetical protein [Metabacillus kandeliae]MCD7034987.1 hypothetical protein [Metabacillus kandeliae]
MKKILVSTANRKEGKLLFEAEPYEGSTNELAPTGQILADSDQLSFIYILENSEEFIYLNLPHHLWGTIHEARNSETEAAVMINGTEIKLNNFFPEMQALLENIKGNANYGEDMEKQVSGSFSL